MMRGQLVKLLLGVNLLVFALVSATPWKDVKKGIKDFKKGHYEQALKRFKKADGKSDEHLKLALNESSALYMMGKYDEAAKVVAKAITENPEIKDTALYSALFYNLGNCFFKADSIARAAEFYKAALKLNPYDEDAKYNLELAMRLLNESGGGGGSSKKKQGGQSKQQKSQQKKKEQQEKQQAQQEQAKKQKQEQQKAQMKKGAMSKEEAEKLLEAFQRQQQEMINQQLKQRRRGARYENPRDW